MSRGIGVSTPQGAQTGLTFLHHDLSTMVHLPGERLVGVGCRAVCDEAGSENLAGWCILLARAAAWNKRGYGTGDLPLAT